MWSVGCIFAEILTKTPLFPSKSESETVQSIFKLLGTPTEESWPGWTTLPNTRSLRANERQYPHAGFRKALKLGGNAGFASGAFVSDLGLDLLQGLLTMDPERRLTAEEALAHPWFLESPSPADPRLLPAFPE
jgi:cell division cycle 2-like protein